MDYRFDTISLAVSQHYKLLKSIVSSSTEVRLLTHEEAEMADYLTDVIERVAGRKLADYCRVKFQNGWSTRDLRSYKIKFVLTKLRDMLKRGRPEKLEMIERIDDLVSRAEWLAGCTTDDKRRNKQAMADRKKSKTEKNHQMDLFEYAESQSSGNDMDEISDKDLCVDFMISGSKTICDDEPIIDLLPDKPAITCEKPQKKAKRVKKIRKSAKERKFERMTKDILESEYGIDPADEEDRPYARDDDENDDNNEPEYAYGKTYGDTISVYGTDDGDNW